MKKIKKIKISPLSQKKDAKQNVKQLSEMLKIVEKFPVTNDMFPTRPGACWGICKNSSGNY